MATKNPFEAIKIDSAGQKKSYDWYRQQIDTLFKASTQSTVNKLKAESKLVTTIVPGEMYLYYYDPKFKETLPYYDQLPLVLPFRKTPTGFYGINLHYLPYGIRFKILNLLAEYAVTNKSSTEKRVRLSWELLENTSKLKPAQFAVKQYLTNHVRSSFYKIPYDDWITASQLPVEQFKKVAKTQVWRDFNNRNF
jgi:hypothetical protein